MPVPGPTRRCESTVRRGAPLAVDDARFAAACTRRQEAQAVGGRVDAAPQLRTNARQLVDPPDALEHAFQHAVALAEKPALESGATAVVGHVVAHYS